MDAIEELLTRGVDTIYPTKEKLEKVLRSGKKLRVFQGFDPTGINLHIGHLTGLMKLRQFQNLGHQVIFLIGDGTGQAGDPSGKKRTREKFLKLTELKNNAKDYVLQAKKIIRFRRENAAEIRYNSDWLNKLTLVEILEIAGHFSLQQLEERDLYEQRKKNHEEINFREFLYPLLQGYDSVAMNIDVEIGGSDQMFNMLAGRKLVREIQNREKFVLTTPLLTDTQGNKIGKTEGNVIAINSSAKDFYSMIMRLPDDIIIKCFERITDVPMSELVNIRHALENRANPMEYKKKLAFSLTRMLNSEKDASEAENFFSSTFQKQESPKDVPLFRVSNNRVTAVSLVMESGLVKSKSEARRLIEQGAVEYNGKRIDETSGNIPIVNKGILKVGKHRFAGTISF